MSSKERRHRAVNRPPPLIPAGFNWEARAFFRIRPDEVLADFRSGDPRYGLISECELAAISACMVDWAKQASHQFLLMGSGNMDAIAWTSNGEAKQGASMRLLFCLRLYCICIIRDIDFSVLRYEAVATLRRICYQALSARKYLRGP